MVDLTASNTLLASAALSGRSKAAVLNFCAAVLAESTSTTNHTQRLTWAGQALGQTDWINTKVFELLVVDSVVGPAGDDSTDTQVQTSVTSICTALAAAGLF